MPVPNALYLDCPSCGEHSVHEVLKGKIGGRQETLEATVRCAECDHVWRTVVKEPEQADVPIIVSEGGESKKRSIRLDAEERVTVGDELWLNEMHLLVTAIEIEDARRAPSATAADAKTIWAKRFDKVVVKISVNKHTRTIAAQTEAAPDEEFYVGDMMDVGNEKVVIHSIRSREGSVRRGGVPARDIVRIYAKAVRQTYS